MYVTELGIVMEVKLVHLSKAFWPILVAEFEIITEVRLVHPEKTY